MSTKKSKNKTKPKKLPPRLELINHFAYDIDTGELRLRKSGKKVGWKDKRGYCHVRYKNVTYKLHRIVYKMFHGKDPGNKVIDHRDGNPSNNRIDNLRCVLRKTNTKNTIHMRKAVGLPAKDTNCTKQSKDRLRIVFGFNDDF